MISIIIPVYNQAKKLDQCLTSIQNQIYSNYEIIVVNDRSTDRLSPMVKKYKKELGIKIDFYHNQTNHGASYARNKGFQKSKGEFVLFCDADIVMEPVMLKVMLETLKDNNQASYVYSSFKYGQKTFKLWEFDAAKLKQMPYIHTTSLIRREHFPGFDESLKRLQDWDLWLTMLEQEHLGVWINRILFSVHSGGTISSWLPSLAYKLFPFLPQVKKYNKAIEIVKKKHNLITHNS